MALERVLVPRRTGRLLFNRKFKQRGKELDRLILDMTSIPAEDIDADRWPGFSDRLKKASQDTCPEETNKNSRRRAKAWYYVDEQYNQDKNINLKQDVVVNYDTLFDYMLRHQFQ